MSEVLHLAAFGIGIAQVRIAPGALDLTFYGGADHGAGVCRRTYRATGDLREKGTFHLSEAGLDMAITRCSPYSFNLAVERGGQPVAKGLALTDRDDPQALMVAWWTGETQPYGVVKYSIRDPETIIGYYISKMTPDVPGEDIVIGSTADGFRGNFVLNSLEAGGRTWGPHYWTVSQRGRITDITWEEHGRIFCRGFGMIDPQDSGSIIATYIPV
ncbi:MAG: hypothetical protein EON57_02065 [Alphaproteobacteria bacterium]|nr:MAG: hypothetical protein EON57_02065 [Alphaproteobacteria bacterium]